MSTYERFIDPGRRTAVSPNAHRTLQVPRPSISTIRNRSARSAQNTSLNPTATTFNYANSGFRAPQYRPSRLIQTDGEAWKYTFEGDIRAARYCTEEEFNSIKIGTILYEVEIEKTTDSTEEFPFISKKYMTSEHGRLSNKLAGYIVISVDRPSWSWTGLRVTTRGGDKDWLQNASIEQRKRYIQLVQPGSQDPHNYTSFRLLHLESCHANGTFNGLIDVSRMRTFKATGPLNHWGEVLDEDKPLLVAAVGRIRRIAQEKAEDMVAHLLPGSPESWNSGLRSSPQGSRLSSSISTEAPTNFETFQANYDADCGYAEEDFTLQGLVRPEWPQKTPVSPEEDAARIRVSDLEQAIRIADSDMKQARSDLFDNTLSYAQDDFYYPDKIAESKARLEQCKKCAAETEKKLSELRSEELRASIDYSCMMKARETRDEVAQEVYKKEWDAWSTATTHVKLDSSKRRRLR